MTEDFERQPLPFHGDHLKVLLNPATRHAQVK